MREAASSAQAEEVFIASLYPRAYQTSQTNQRTLCGTYLLFYQATTL